MVRGLGGLQQGGGVGDEAGGLGLGGERMGRGQAWVGGYGRVVASDAVRSLLGLLFTAGAGEAGDGEGEGTRRGEAWGSRRYQPGPRSACADSQLGASGVWAGTRCANEMLALPRGRCLPYPPPAMTPIRLGINGMGRIGRLALRHALARGTDASVARKGPPVEVVAANDLAESDEWPTC